LTLLKQHVSSRSTRISQNVHNMLSKKTIAEEFERWILIFSTSAVALCFLSCGESSQTRARFARDFFRDGFVCQTGCHHTEARRQEGIRRSHEKRAPGIWEDSPKERSIYSLHSSLGRNHAAHQRAHFRTETEPVHARVNVRRNSADGSFARLIGYFAYKFSEPASLVALVIPVLPLVLCSSD
jgi:hypothetical protein